MKKRILKIFISAILTLVFAGVFFYITLPAINWQSDAFWMYLFYCIAFYIVSYAVITFILEKKKDKNAKPNFKLKKSPAIIIAAIALSIPMAVLGVGSLISSTFFHANAYSSIIEVPEADFAEDMPETEVVNNIALMDTNTAIIMGERTLGDLIDVVSQYKISVNYKQINYKGTPQKISTLEYADFFKWLTNRKNGIPGYVMVDPVNAVTKANYIEFSKPIKYSESGFFGDDLMRKLRFSYPTKIFGNCSFEIDEEGNPFYIVACMKPKVAMFGAYDVNEVIIFDPVSGESEIKALKDVPSWVDNVFTGTLASQKYDWYGTLKNGYWNSVIGNRDCKVTTDDYGYIVIGDDVWFYTGVTSVTSDESNIGFIISNARTGEYKFYKVSGAEEYSAMESAQGQVQEKGYVASFPSLINVSGEATYIMVLKDGSGLVKLYALVNVKNHAIVETGSTQLEAKQKYLERLKSEGIIDKIPENTQGSNISEATVEIADIKVYTVGGESVFYITATDGQIYKQRLCDDEYLIILRVGDEVTVKYRTDNEGSPLIREMISFKILPESSASDTSTTDKTE